MKELEFSGWMNVGCYIDGDCAYAEFKCKNAVLTVKKYCAPRFEMDTCPECGAEFETPLFALDNPLFLLHLERLRSLYSKEPTK